MTEFWLRSRGWEGMTWDELGGLSIYHIPDRIGWE